jgi:molybdenum cofactor cytidylyltransferase
VLDMSSCEGVILAAGLSTRAGGFKPELPLGDKTVVQMAAAGMAPFVSRIFVVIGWQGQRVQELLAGYSQVEIVPNADYRSGMFSSVRAGIAHVRAARFFLLPGDCPLVAPETYRALRATAGEIVIPVHGGHKGHPVLFDSTLIPEILGLPQESNLRDYIARKGYTPLEAQDRAVLLDLDTPDDYRSLTALAGTLQRTDGKEASS